jgi:cytochrome P450
VTSGDHASREIVASLIDSCEDVGVGVAEHVAPGLVRDFDYHTDGAFLVDPFAALDRMREDRVFFSPAYGGYWVLTRAEDVRDAFQQPGVFSSAQFSIPTGVYPRTMRPLALDPPQHGQYRQPLAPLFAPAAVSRREPELRRICSDLVGGFAGAGRCDLVAELARPFPTTMFVVMLGLPLEEAATFQRWNHDLTHAYDDPSVRRDAAQSIVRYLDELVRAREKEDPAGEDLLSALTQASVAGRPLDHEELVDYAFMLFVAGLDTVTAMLSFTFQALATDPDLRAKLVARPDLVPQAVEEFLRARAIINTARVVTRDVTFAGVAMRAGDRVLLSTALASRDPREVDRADQIELDRTVNRHLAFGAGPHRCVGSHLARLELAIAVEELLRRVPDFRLVPDERTVVHGGGSFGIDQLVVEWPVRS